MIGLKMGENRRALDSKNLHGVDLTLLHLEHLLRYSSVVHPYREKQLQMDRTGGPEWSHASHAKEPDRASTDAGKP